MKRSIATLVPVFNTNRMVEEYTETVLRAERTAGPPS